ncbi:hypothetical protein [Nostoc sp. WHI]|uniref:hypothetical protein n=1 Tax=Nostoc sp. WHI TaxID=2650611 RepID=UPI0018C830E4|nr:hypothetical protein [Nostoc sp. WHI]
MGLTSIGDSPQQAQDIYNKVIKVLDQETRSDNHDFSAFSGYSFPVAWDEHN